MAVAEARDLYTARFDGVRRRAAPATDPSWLTTIRRNAFASFQALGLPDDAGRGLAVHADCARSPTRPSPRPADADGHEGRAVAVRRPPDALHAARVRQRPLLGRRCRRRARWAGRAGDEPRRGAGDRPGPGRSVPHAVRVRATSRRSSRSTPPSSRTAPSCTCPANAVVPEPIHVIYFSTATGDAARRAPAHDHRRGRQQPGEGGRELRRPRRRAATSPTRSPRSSCGENAHVEHYRVQRESHHAYHVVQHARVPRAQRGLRSAERHLRRRHRPQRRQRRHGRRGRQLHAQRPLPRDGTRLVDNHTAIDHAKPHCESHEVYKGMLDGHARGVFNGKIFVRPQAQKTDAKQTNKMLLLSDDATINTKPQLEIFADDVKCTHGATVGQLDDDVAVLPAGARHRRRTGARDADPRLRERRHRPRHDRAAARGARGDAAHRVAESGAHRLTFRRGTRFPGHHVGTAGNRVPGTR